MREISTSRKVAFTLLLLFGALLMCEGAVRARSWLKYGGAATSLRDPLITYDASLDLHVPTPGYEIKGRGIGVKINSLGFRGDEFSRLKPAGTVRIAVLGASTTFNMEVSSNHATWPHRLQERLRAAYPGVSLEVVNASLGGYVAADNLKNLRHRVLPLDPDLVIYYEAHNEIVHDTGRLAVAQGLVDAAGRSWLVKTLSSWSLLFDLVHKNGTMLLRSRDTSTKKIGPDSTGFALDLHRPARPDACRTRTAQDPVHALHVHRQVPARPGSGHPDRERGRRLLLHAMDVD